MNTFIMGFNMHEKTTPVPPNAGCGTQSFVRVLIKPYKLGSEFIKTIFCKNTGCSIICVTILAFYIFQNMGRTFK